MHSPDSADFSSASTDEHGEIELAAVNNSGVTVIKDNDQSKVDNREKTFTIDTKLLFKWNQIIVVFAFTALLSLLGTSIFIDRKIMSMVLLKEFVMINIISFFFAINGIISKYPEISKTCSLIALVSMILSFTELSSALVRPNFSWIPWILFAVTCVSLTCYAACEVYSYVRNKKNGNVVIKKERETSKSP